MNNELMITFFGGGYVYFSTNAADVNTALERFKIVCERNGINIDNMKIVSATLRDEFAGDIEYKKFD